MQISYSFPGGLRHRTISSSLLVGRGPALGALITLLASLSLFAGSASAAPSWGVGMVHKNLYGVGGMVSMYDDSGSEGFSRESGGNAYSIQVTNTSLEVGTSLTCESGTWTGSPTFSYQWYRNGIAIPGATSAVHTTEALDSDQSVQCAVTGTNAGGAFVRYTVPRLVGSAGSAGLPRAAEPVITASNGGSIGSELTCNPEWGWRWPTFSYQWLKNGALIVGATNSTYTIQAGDAPSAIQCLVIATNTAGSVSVATAAQETVPAPSPLAPKSSVATGPKIEGGSLSDSAGGTTAGQTLTCTGSSVAAATLAYQWLRNGAAISGATTSTYTTGAIDAEMVLQCRVTATTAEAVSVTTSAAVTISPLPGTAAPSGATAWTVSGTTSLGSILACNNGTWTGSPTLTYQWLRNSTAISGAINSTYTIAAADVGTNLQCQVTGVNAGGTFVAQSRNTFIVAPVTPPSASINPTISGAITVGNELTCNSGTWANSPSFGWEWLRNGVTIGITTQKYTLTAADEGKVLQCRVTASNATSIAQAMSANTIVPPIGGMVPPSLTTAKNLLGVASVGSNLTCNHGTWANSPFSYTFQWLRNGVVVAGAMETTTKLTSQYTVVAADLNKSIQCMVTATNEGGSSVAINAASASVDYVNPTAPSVSATISRPNSVSVSVALPAGMELSGSGNGAAFESNTNDSIGFTFGLSFAHGTTMIIASGWACDVVTVTCARSDALAPGESYPPIVLHVRPRSETADMVAPVATVFGGGTTPPSASASDPTQIFPSVPLGVHSFTAWVEDESGQPYTQAGGHPFEAGTQVIGNSHPTSSGGIYIAGGDIKSVQAELPPGFTGNPQNFPQCPASVATAPNNESCPENTAVGYIEVSLPWTGGAPPTSTGGILFGGGGAGINVSPLWNMEPERGLPAQLAFKIQSIPYVLEARLRSDSDYGLTLGSRQIPASPSINGVRVVACDDGIEKVAGPFAGGTYRCAPTPPNAVPFLDNASKCAGEAPLTTLRLNSYQRPDEYVEVGGYVGAPSPVPGLQGQPVKGTPVPGSYVKGCEALTAQFKPTFSFQPESKEAESPTGVNVDLHVPQTNRADTLMAPALKKTIVTLPEGVVLSPSAGGGLGACTIKQIGLIGTGFGTPNPIHFNEDPVACPDSSKIGTMEVETPLLSKPLDGNVYVAAQNDNPFHSTFAIYLGIDDAKTGLVIKLPGLVEADPTTGRLTVTFDYTPQLPVEHIRLHFFGGPRASLANPATCGEKTTTTQIVPWSAADPENPTPAEISTPTDSFTVSGGPDGTPCANTAAERPFSPSLSAGTASTTAGAFTPFSLRLSRNDGEQELQSVDVNTPPGFVGVLTGIPFCPEAAIKAAEANTGTAEQQNPSCPAASQLGTLTAAVGVGSTPFYASGKAYLAGAYKDAPFSIVFVTPAVAGPFDLGDVVVRAGIYVNPDTAQITVKAEQIPQILDGVPLQVRSIEANVNRPNFGLNPTSCEKSKVSTTVYGASGAVASPSNSFQVGGCSSLGFKPRFEVSTSAKTSRTNGASLSVKLSYPTGSPQANVAKVKVELPRQLPSRLTTLQKACPEAVFAANPASCPKESIVGTAKATTPVLPVPVVGPAYFVSHGGAKFPELILVLQGYGITIDLHGETFINKAGITSSTFNTVPDVPVGYFELTLPEGPYSALAANGNLCASKLTMPTQFAAQNGAQVTQNTKIKVTGCAKTKTLTRAQKLKAALKACHKLKNKTKRHACEKTAKKHYGPVKGKKARGRAGSSPRRAGPGR